MTLLVPGPGTWAPCPAIFGGLGFAELLMIAFVSILVFGGRLPEVMRNLGQAYARIRRSLTEMSAPIRHEIERATTLPPDTSPLGQGLPDVSPPEVAPSDVPSVPYDVAVPPAPPDLGTPEPASPWPSARPGPAPDVAPPASPPPDRFDEPPPV